MMHKAWSRIEEAPYCFLRSYVKLQGHTAKKSSTLTQIGRFRTVTPVWIHQWLRNDAQIFNSTEEVSHCFSKSYVELQGHTAKKIIDFDPNWAFPDCNSSLNSPMATKWCTKLEVALKRCPVVFQGHTSNCKVTRLKNCRFWPQLVVSELLLQFEFTAGFEMMHKAWCSIEEVPYYFSGSSIKFQGNTG